MAKYLLSILLLTCLVTPVIIVINIEQSERKLNDSFIGKYFISGKDTLLITGWNYEGFDLINRAKVDKQLIYKTVK